ncbi:dynein heavy chain 12, axonemal [Elysia marginata]|uniref:Dynein heavy chain 12, axonemal n=1 Tax=Elysia marginata TaxID=1093978 RepID=A0AAV4JK42_9GAST|nr:dynein heavy chain 12, axonemal [Elysia marginata]
MYADNVDQDFTNVEKMLMERWYPAAVGIFKKEKLAASFDTHESKTAYLTSSSNLLSTMVKQLLVGCLERYLNSFLPENHLLLPHLGMNLTLRDGEMMFDRGLEELENTVLYFVHRLCQTMQKVSISPVSDLCENIQKVSISSVSDLCQTMQKVSTSPVSEICQTIQKVSTPLVSDLCQTMQNVSTSPVSEMCQTI